MVFERSAMSRFRIVSASLLTAVVGAGVVAATSFATAGAATVVKPTVVQVKASEFKFVLSTKTIAKPGPVTFVVKNVGKEAHNFVLLSGINKTTPLIQPGKTATLKVTFKKAGSYTYECSVGEHAEEGMLGKLVVK
jgi:plastocyanin